MDDVVLKTGREKSVLRRHPWIFSGAIQHVSGNPGLGDTVLIRDSTGQELALGAYSPASNIRIRLWTWEPRSTIGKAFFKARLEQSLSARKSLICVAIWTGSPPTRTALYTPNQTACRV